MPSPGQIDLELLLLLRTRGHEPLLERPLAACSRLGEHAACWLALGAVGCVVDGDATRRARWRRGIGVVAGAYGLNYAVKLLVRRPRPEIEGLPALAPIVSGLSFPSAHATTSFAAASAYSGLASTAALYGAAVVLAVSRPYLGVHYPSDVLAGAILGTLVAAAWPASTGGDSACR